MGHFSQKFFTGRVACHSTRITCSHHLILVRAPSILKAIAKKEFVIPQLHRLVTGDAAKKLDSVPDRSCRLVITSPPYNIGKSYERGRRQSLG
jgi:hypothetical protein